MPQLLPGYVRDTEFAALLKRKTGYGTPQTLYRWRRQGIGPKWIKVGRAVLYQVDQEFEPVNERAAKEGAR